MEKNTTTIGQYLIDSLKEININHIFGIPGDYVINFFSKLEQSSIETIGTCSEQGAAFAADAYSRLNGVGALCVTYCVGGLNTINAVAGAYAEKAPLVIISGAPGVNERDSDYLLHHSIRDLDSQYNIYKNVTIAATQLDDPSTAVFEIDRVLEACIKYKRPVYIELPRDMVNQECVIPPEKTHIEPKHDATALKEALKEASEIIQAAKNPVIVGGVEIKRYHLENQFIELLESTKYPYATTFLGKAVIDESHPQFIGVYMGQLGKEHIREHIEEADCTIMLGTLMTDTNLATAQLDPAKTIFATADELCIKHHYYRNIDISEFISGLSQLLKSDKEKTVYNKYEKHDYEPKQGEPIKVNRFFERLNNFLDEDSIVVCDVGDCLFGSADLKIPKDSAGYLGPVYYTSMGYAVPAALGAQVKIPNSRPIVIVGDGAFQMTGHEISCFAHYDLNPIIFVINNKGYTTQRYLKDGSFNNIYNWNYHKWPELLGKGLGLEVSTEDDLEEVLEKAKNNTNSFTIVNIHFEKFDRSDMLYRLTSHFSKKVIVE